MYYRALSVNRTFQDIRHVRFHAWRIHFFCATHGFFCGIYGIVRGVFRIAHGVFEIIVNRGCFAPERSHYSTGIVPILNVNSTTFAMLDSYFSDAR